MFNTSYAKRNVAHLNGKSLMISIDRINLNGLNDEELSKYDSFSLVNKGIGAPDLKLTTYSNKNWDVLLYDEQRVEQGDVIEYDLYDYARDSIRKNSTLKSIDEIPVKLAISEIDFYWIPIMLSKYEILDTGNEITVGALLDNEQLTMKSENPVLGISYEFTLWIED